MDPLPATILQPSVTAIPATDPTAHLEMIGDEKQSGGNVLLLLAALGGRVEVEGLETCMAGNMGGGICGGSLYHKGHVTEAYQILVLLPRQGHVRGPRGRWRARRQCRRSLRCLTNRLIEQSTFLQLHRDRYIALPISASVYVGLP